MKLWIKISLIAIIMLTIATSICSLIMLTRSGQSNLDLAIQNTLTDQKMRSTTWKNMINKDVMGNIENTTQRSLARYYITQYADDNTVLISGSDFIFNTTSIDPKEYLPLTGLEQDIQQYTVGDISSKTVLIAGSNIQINEIQYALYIIRDISDVYAGIETLSYQFTLINLGVLAAATLVIVFLVRLVLKPVKTLKRNTGLIANGIYDKRIAVAEKDEIGELAGDFNLMAAAVEKHVQELENEAARRSLFMSALTHELKTPITSISGNAQTLLRTKLTDEEREDALLRIDDECTRIERLSQKMMQLIVLQQDDNIELKPQSVNTLLDAVHKSCTQQLQQRGITLNIENNLSTLDMDTDLLSSLFINLVDNAGKASQPGDTISLCAKANTIAVIDHGKGIPPKEINHITQPFYTVDKSRSKKSGSIGLGLALCKEIAALHGARLEFESELNKGTTVKVVFEHA